MPPDQREMTRQVMPLLATWAKAGKLLPHLVTYLSQERFVEHYKFAGRTNVLEDVRAVIMAATLEDHQIRDESREVLANMPSQWDGDTLVWDVPSFEAEAAFERLDMTKVGKRHGVTIVAKAGGA